MNVHQNHFLLVQANLIKAEFGEPAFLQTKPYAPKRKPSSTPNPAAGFDLELCMPSPAICRAGSPQESDENRNSDIPVWFIVALF